MEQLGLTNYQEYKPQTLQTAITINTQISAPESLEKTIATILPSTAEENKTSKMRSLLGEAALSLTDEKIECIRSEFQFLMESWLDEFERNVFDNKTLKELLNEEG